MKNLVTRLMFLFAIVCSNISNAQHGHGGKGHGEDKGQKGEHHNGTKSNGNNYRGEQNNHYNKNNYYNHPSHLRSKYHPQTVMQYHTNWGKQRSYNRRWVYFPSHNFYWDNWRQMYVYNNANKWYANSIAPQFILNLNLENERQFELNEEDDDLDNIYNSNQVHFNLYLKK